VTPLKDGMNLVCKEYCATRADEDGVLMLSEFAGASGRAAARRPARESLRHRGGRRDDPPRARDARPPLARSRMRRLRRVVFENDIYRWVDRFLAAAIARELNDFPVVEEYLPEAARDVTYLPIEHHGVIGDLHTAALVGLDGTIDWLCLPYFDSPSIFASILDDRAAGSAASPR
jgi:hypothetical protein